MTLRRKRQDSGSRRGRTVEQASEIRLRAPGAGAAVPDPEGDRDTIPSPAPRFDSDRLPWADLDRQLSLRLLHAQCELDASADRHAAAQAASTIEDVAALSDALFLLWSHDPSGRWAWGGAVARAYGWATDVAAEVADAVASADDGDVPRTFRRLSEYSKLFVEGVLHPALLEAMEDAAGRGAPDERLQDVAERVVILAWALARTARELR
jgi:hypothetical protein